MQPGEIAKELTVEIHWFTSWSDGFGPRLSLYIVCKDETRGQCSLHHRP